LPDSNYSKWGPMGLLTMKQTMESPSKEDSEFILKYFVRCSGVGSYWKKLSSNYRQISIIYYIWKNKYRFYRYLPIIIDIYPDKTVQKRQAHLSVINDEKRCLFCQLFQEVAWKKIPYIMPGGGGWKKCWKNILTIFEGAR